MSSRIEIVNNYQHISIHKAAVENIILNFLSAEKLPAREITIIFADDNFLRTLHRDYLNDNTFTDIITFNLSDDARVEGEIYISVERAKTHSAEFGVTLSEEIARLVIHGLLHLKGYDDQEKRAQQLMRQKEDFYLGKYAIHIREILNRTDENEGEEQ